MQLDALITLPFFDTPTNTGLYALFDGHGNHGSDAVSFMKTRLPELIERPVTDPASSLMSALKQCDDELRRSSSQILLSGCSAVVLIIQPNRLYCANIGRSRALLAKELKVDLVTSKRLWSGVELTCEHTPSDARERSRIEQCGGRVISEVDENGKAMGLARICLPKQSIPGLPQSRSIGDTLAKSIGATSDVDISYTELGPEDKFIVVGSAFMFDAVKLTDTIKVAARYRTQPKKAADALVRLAQHHETEASALVISLRD